jgi:hypothetical protein
LDEQPENSLRSVFASRSAAAAAALVLFSFRNQFEWKEKPI